MAQAFDTSRYAELINLTPDQLAAHPALKSLPAGLVRTLCHQMDNLRLLSGVNNRLSIVVMGQLTRDQVEQLEEVHQFSVENEGQQIHIVSQGAGVGARTRIGILMASQGVSPARVMWQPHAPTDGTVQVRLQFRLMRSRRRSEDTPYVIEVPSLREITALAAMLSTYTLEPEVFRPTESWTPMVAWVAAFASTFFSVAAFVDTSRMPGVFAINAATAFGMALLPGSNPAASTGRSITLGLAAGNAAAYMIYIGEDVRIPLTAELLVVAIVVINSARTTHCNIS